MRLARSPRALGPLQSPSWVSRYACRLANLGANLGGLQHFGTAPRTDAAADGLGVAAGPVGRCQFGAALCSGQLPGRELVDGRLLLESADRRPQRRLDSLGLCGHERLCGVGMADMATIVGAPPDR